MKSGDTEATEDVTSSRVVEFDLHFLRKAVLAFFGRLDGCLWVFKNMNSGLREVT